MRKRKMAKTKRNTDSATKVISNGEVLHILLPHSIRYHITFTTENITRQYIGEIPDSYENKDEEFDKIVQNAIIFASL